VGRKSGAIYFDGKPTLSLIVRALSDVGTADLREPLEKSSEPSEGGTSRQFSTNQNSN
jgi:hypothetical protein